MSGANLGIGYDYMYGVVKIVLQTFDVLTPQNKYTIIIIHILGTFSTKVIT